MSFLDGFQNAFPVPKPYDQKYQNPQKPVFDDPKGGFGDIGDIGLRLSPVKNFPDEQSATDDPTPEQIAHARRMLVDCPSTGGRVHCWHCSRCGDARRCAAWHHRRSDVEFFKRSGEPYSLYLVGSGAVEVLQ